MKKNISVILGMILAFFTANISVFAEGEADAKGITVKAIAAAVIMTFASAAGTVSMAIAVGKAADGTARQPEAAGSIRTAMMMGLVFIETAIIYALITAIIIIFVL